MSADLFRRRLGLSSSVNVPTRSPARCLFGSPDVKVAKDMVEKIEAVQAWSFSKRWNFDITGKPEPPKVLESRTSPLKKYQWNETFDENQMARCDQNRLQVPVAPKGRLVPLLIAPTITMESKCQRHHENLDENQMEICDPPHLLHETPLAPKTRIVPLFISPTSEPLYQCHETFEDNQLSKCNRHRDEAPVAPKARIIPLFISPTPEPVVPQKIMKSRSRSYRQKTLLYYMQVKKIQTRPSPKSNKGKKIQ